MEVPSPGICAATGKMSETQRTTADTKRTPCPCDLRLKIICLQPRFGRIPSFEVWKQERKMQPVRSGRLPEDRLRTRKTVNCYR